MNFNYKIGLEKGPIQGPKRRRRLSRINAFIKDCTAETTKFRSPVILEKKNPPEIRPRISPSFPLGIPHEIYAKIPPRVPLEISQGLSLDIPPILTGMSPRISPGVPLGISSGIPLRNPHGTALGTPLEILVGITSCIPSRDPPRISPRIHPSNPPAYHSGAFFYSFIYLKGSGAVKHYRAEMVELYKITKLFVALSS